MFNGLNKAWFPQQFVQKLWIMHNELKNKISKEKEEIYDKEIEKFTTQLIAKFTENLEKFNYNVIIANMYETYNYLNNYIKTHKNLKNLKDNYKKILICFTPILPHFANECFEDLGIKDKIEWPKYDLAVLENEEINFVIQVNGKKRSILSIKKGSKEKDIMKLVKKDKIIDKYLNNKEIKKVIFVENRLMNILVNE